MKVSWKQESPLCVQMEMRYEKRVHTMGHSFWHFPVCCFYCSQKNRVLTFFFVYVTIPLSVVSFFLKKSFGFLYLFLKSPINFKTSLQFNWPLSFQSRECSSASYGLPGMFLSDCTGHCHMDRMWRARLAGSHANTLTHCLAKSPSDPLWSEKSNLCSNLRERAQWSRSVTCHAQDNPSSDW